MKPMLRFGVPAYLLLEVFVTLEIAGWLGKGRTLLLLLLSVVAGVAVLRRGRVSIVARLRRAAVGKELVLASLLDSAARVAAGILFVIPGFVGDVIALSLLVPRFRRWLVRRFSASVGLVPARFETIEGDYRRVDNRLLPEAEQGDR